MNALIRTSDEPVSAVIDGPFLANMPFMLNLVTDYGEMDLTFEPSGGLGGFDDWNAKAIVVDIAEGVSVHIAALDDIIESKQAANRPKDRAPHKIFAESSCASSSRDLNRQRRPSRAQRLPGAPDVRCRLYFHSARRSGS
jgi:hypothetical protein